MIILKDYYSKKLSAGRLRQAYGEFESLGRTELTD